ncbi:MAG TPA: hypothetical protein VNA16_00030 [Abditibacteriaceae bacterium]|nr:hypothetical protein [Abditibacteriaceae bacterium]
MEGSAQFQQGGQTGQTGTRGARGGATGSGGGSFELPEGVDQIIAVDPQNALLVYGTEEGVRRLETIIAYLDRPLRQVEIEAQFVTVTQSSLSAFGIDWSGANNGPFTTSVNGLAPSPGPGTFSLGYLRGNFQATLRAQVSQNRAKTVSSPRVTAINNLTASLFTSVSQPLLLSSATTGIGGQTGESQNLVFITTSVGLTVTPTINNDDTITVVMQPQVQNPNLVNVGGQTIPAPITQTVQTIANVRDGDTIALGGLRTKRSARGGARIPILSNIPFIGQFFRENRKSDSDEDLIIFLTARILRRAEDTEPVPGT